MVHWFLASFVSATLQVLLQKLADGITIYGGQYSEFSKRLHKPNTTVLTTQVFLRDAEDKEIRDSMLQVKMQALEELAYDADDLIDEIAIKFSKLEAGGQFNQVNELLLSLFKRSSETTLNNMLAKFEDLLVDIERPCLRNFLQRPNFDTQMLLHTLQTTSLADEAQVFGREIDKQKIINMLVTSEESSRANCVSIIPIVGIFGVGKTTLARLVYNHDYQDEFNLKMWVSVTRDFDIMRVTRSIIEATKCGNSQHLALELLHLELQQILRDKKYLLVLDDLWNENPNDLALLLEPLKHGLKGSKIIITTRSSRVVSSLVATARAYHLKCLSDNDCWLLLKHQAFGDIYPNIDPKLEAIGKEIARRCNGFPLVAKSVGRLLGVKLDEDAWNGILEYKIWYLQGVQGEAVPALRSSYDSLPLHLKQCFAYCSIFPQRHDFEKDKIVQMWMGEGFITRGQSKERTEGLGADYFNQLFSMTIFDNEAGKYKMNEAVHNLAQSVFCNKFLRMEETDESCINTNTRHLSLICAELQTKTLETFYKCKGLRTFLLSCEHGTSIKELPLVFFLKLGSLRVLDLSSTQMKELTKSIGNLKHLRFLDLSNTLLKLLPEAVQELCLLQTLRLVNCVELLKLPKSTSRLKSLQHLELDGANQLTSMPSGIGKLIGLQTITKFVVGPESGQMKELKGMNSIRGSLCIKQLDMVSNPQEALEANLPNKKYLDELELQWNSVGESHNDEHVLDKLMPSHHKGLKKLTLQRYGGTMFPAWVSDPRFSKLTNISFSKCKNCRLLPTLGQLPKLKHLRIDGMHELTRVDEIFIGNIGGFQSLETLEFNDMSKLKMWVGVRDTDMACLRELTIGECPQMNILPSLHYFRSLKKLKIENCSQIPSLPKEKLSSSIESLIINECPVLEERCKRDGGEDWMKIEHIPYIEIDYDRVNTRMN